MYDLEKEKELTEYILFLEDRLTALVQGDEIPFNPELVGFNKENSHLYCYKKGNITFKLSRIEGLWCLGKFTNKRFIRDLFYDVEIKSHSFGLELLKSLGVIE